MSATVPTPRAVGKMTFRFFLDSRQRLLVQQPAVSEIDFPGPVDNSAAESLRLSGTWGPLTEDLQVRPIFPGAMRFMAAEGSVLPRAEDIEVVNGHVTDRALDRFAFSGRIMVRVQSSEALKTLNKFGMLPFLNEAPTHAWYGPITLTRDFLRSALLNYKTGLKPARIYPAGNKLGVDPGAPEWEALALSGFLHGEYEPWILAGSSPAKDDAVRLHMPKVVLGANQAFHLDVTIGWPRSISWTVDPAQPASVEIIPTRAFMQHIRSSLQDPPARGVKDSVFEAVLDGAVDSTGWGTDLTTRLSELGFGSPSGQTPTEYMLRAFQINSSWAKTATPVYPAITTGQLALRQFNDLRQTDNLDPYLGPVSGRPNQRTRELLRTWQRMGYRSAVIIGAFDASKLDAEGQPTVGPLAGYEDLWNRTDLSDTSPRVFAADFSRPDLATDRINLSELEAIGTFATWDGHQGPGSLQPGRNSERPAATAELTSQKLLDASEASLLTPLPDTTADLLRQRRLSTFKVIRAMSEQECYGYLDRINAYDGAGMSVGVCHWAMAHAEELPHDPTELGGLAAYLAYLEDEKGFAGADVFRRLGLGIVSKDSLAKVVNNINEKGMLSAVLGFVNDRNQAYKMGAPGPKEYMPSWRSYYYWFAVARRNKAFGLSNWHMIRRRLRELLAAPFTGTNPKDTRQSANITPTIATVFTSEIAIAQILRWHVKFPGHVMGADGASRHLKSIYSAAASAKPAPTDSQSWEDELEKALLKHIDGMCKTKGYEEMPEQLRNIVDPPWLRPGDPNERQYSLDPSLRALSSAASSFMFEDDIPEPVNAR